MRNRDLLYCELGNWSKFLIWLKKVNERASKRKNQLMFKQTGEKSDDSGM